jgi:hypothetical protein
MITVYWYLNFVTGEICQSPTQLDDTDWEEWVFLKCVTQ